MSSAHGPRGPAYWFRRRTLSAHANARPKKSLCPEINILTVNTLPCSKVFFKEWQDEMIFHIAWTLTVDWITSNSLSLCFRKYSRTCTHPSAHQFMRMILSLVWPWHVRIVSGAETGGRGLAALSDKLLRREWRRRRIFLIRKIYTKEKFHLHAIRTLFVEWDSLAMRNNPFNMKSSYMSAAQGPRGPAYWFWRRTLSAHANARPKKSLCAKINMLTGNTLSCSEFLFQEWQDEMKICLVRTLSIDWIIKSICLHVF